MTEPSIRGGAWSALATRRPGYWLLRARWSEPEREGVVAAYLGDAERTALVHGRHGARDDRVRGRVAAKDAVCSWLAEQGIDGIGPRDVTIGNDAAGRPVVRVGGRAGAIGSPSVSVAHRSPSAVAVAAGPGEPTGIDVELVEPRGSVFARLALTAAELRLGEAAGVHRDTWVTRVWTVKEAVAKAACTGLRGRPKDFEVHEVDGAWAWATAPDAPRGLWVRSDEDGEWVVSVVARRDGWLGDPCRDA